MPLTSKGKKIQSAMKKQYGEKKGEQVFYGSKNKGRITGVEKTKKSQKRSATAKVGKPKVSKTASQERAFKAGGSATKSRVNEAGNYTKPAMRKRLFESIKAGGKGGKPGQWSARKAQMLAKQYKAKGGGYK
jgi:hypothetical protein